MRSQATADAKQLYRTDIDGLRAVAVLAVVAYHYWGQYFTGGYVGVDIFFVISGYLLSAIIISEVKAGRFSLSRFYERRIRRIFPALFGLLILATPLACIVLLPGDLITYSRSMLAATFSASNFYFWTTSNYFNGSGNTNPLLHTWSLAVEEQFYIVFPLFILFVHRFFPRYLRAVVTLTAIASLAWSIADVRINQTAAFYLPFTRAWELLFGAMLTLRVIPVPRSNLWREILAASGILGIAVSIFAFTGTTLFPGECSILPCAAGGAIIMAGQDQPTITGRALSWRPVVFIGLISYSLYLWHWPLLVFFTHGVAFLRPIRGIHAILAVLSIIVATASWKFVETPFRTGPRRPGKREVFVFGALCVVASGACALVLSNTRGLPGRFPAAADSVAAYLDYKTAFPSDFAKVFRSGCFIDRQEPLAHYDERRCLAPAEGKRQVLLFGDSHAADLQYGLESSIPGVHFLQATSAACHPTIGPGRYPKCKQFLDKVFNEYIPRYSISSVVLNADWGADDIPALTRTIDLILPAQNVSLSELL